jgi:phosphoglycerol transferase MdoB-like AlkP superfamily enzyme
MKKEKSILSSFKILLKRLSIVLFMMTITRLLFLFFNFDSFNNLGFNEFAVAAWFDCITISLFFLPFILIHSLPVSKNIFRIKELILLIYFHAINTLMLALNLMDIEYFKFTSKRSTFDLFAILGAGNDFAQLATTFIKDFWFIIILLIILVGFSELLYRKTKQVYQANQTIWRPLVFNFLIALPLFVLVGRGGFQLKPVGIIEVSQYSNPENSALVLNTPFTMLKSYGKKRLEIKHYYTEKEELAIFNPIQMSQPQHILPDGTNVMIIMLESFGNEFVGAFSGERSFTPFFDSLIGQSLTFEHGIANGKKSIEAVPSILASIPSLMDNPYISSPYGNNKIESLASILKKKGYESGFYHGATNGSMRFDGFAALAGFDHYFGRKEYNNDKHFDKTWGILDEFFNPWTAKQLTKLKEPFFGTLFTLSSHHPYYIPPNWRKIVKQGKQPMCASVNYGDISLKKFFEEAKKQPWYNNTLFILVADHTPSTIDKLYGQRRFMYQIPIVFFHPKKLLPIKKDPIIFQQLDILPTVLDLLNIKTKFYSYGQSYYKKAEREAITYIEGSCFYFKGHHMYTVTNEKARNLYDFTFRKELTNDSLSFYKQESKAVEKRVKAIIQRYNRDLIHNKTVVE